MAAFFVRTTGGKGSISEKSDGKAKFSGKDGKERIVPMMFLSGKMVDESGKPAVKGAKVGRREQFVRIALDDRKFLSRAFVNRTWEYFFGRGLVDPVDQIHSGNPASVSELLDWLADDYASTAVTTLPGLSREYCFPRRTRWMAVGPGRKRFPARNILP